MLEHAASSGHNQRDVQQLLTLLADYRVARQRLMAALDLPRSNRDPLAEWSEQLVTRLLGGTLASNRVQAAYDLTMPDGAHVQVRYPANSTGPWINGHVVQSLAALGVARYALVLFEAFEPVGVLMFPVDLQPICTALGKRHAMQIGCN